MPGKVLSNRNLGAAVFITALIAYAGTVGFEYVWDDPYLINRVREALSTGEISSLFTTSFYVKTVNTARYYRPVMLASLLGDVLLTGGMPWFSHLVNVLVHALNSTLLFFLFRKVLQNDNSAWSGRSFLLFFLSMLEPWQLCITGWNF